MIVMVAGALVPIPDIKVIIIKIKFAKRYSINFANNEIHCSSPEGLHLFLLIKTNEIYWRLLLNLNVSI